LVVVVTLLHIRSPVLKGRGKAFAEELVAWARRAGCQRVVVLAGAEPGGSEDVLQPSRRVRYVHGQAEVGAWWWWF
jgi:predicted ATP-grasp superfamily ATP-dependent carboligase